MNTDLMFSKQSDEWETPQDLFDVLDKEFKFQVDAACSNKNKKCDWYFKDSLNHDWIGYGIDNGNLFLEGPLVGPFWLNPPYSKIAAFMKKAYEESLKGATVVCLIPSRTDTKPWHDYIMKAHEIRFIKGRLRFVGPNCKGPAPFPSCIVVFRGSPYPGFIKVNENYLSLAESPKISTMERPA